MVSALGGYLDPRSGSGMKRMLIRFPIGVGNDNCVVGNENGVVVVSGVINGLWDDRRGMYFYRI